MNIPAMLPILPPMTDKIKKTDSGVLKPCFLDFLLSFPMVRNATIFKNNR